MMRSSNIYIGASCVGQESELVITSATLLGCIIENPTDAIGATRERSSIYVNNYNPCGPAATITVRSACERNTYYKGNTGKTIQIYDPYGTGLYSNFSPFSSVSRV